MASNNLTDNDHKLLAAAWHCFETQPKVNFHKLAEIMGYKNAQTASACFGPVKKKLLASTSGTPTPTPKKATGKGKGKRAAEDAGDDDKAEDGVLAKALKKQRSKKAKAEAEAEAEAAGEGEGEGDAETEAVIKGEVEED